MKIKNRNRHKKIYLINKKARAILKRLNTFIFEKIKDVPIVNISREMITDIIKDFLKQLPKPEIKITCNEDNNPKSNNKLVVDIEIPFYLLLNNEV